MADFRQFIIKKNGNSNYYPVKDSTARNSIGSLNSLKTNTKSSIVNAINEIWNSIRDEVGTVTSINGITPDGTGNIDISPTDLGCVGNPINKGYDGQFLMTDGSGNTYWSDVDPGTDVTVTQTITSGIEIARIKVGSNTVPLYAPSYADVNDRGF